MYEPTTDPKVRGKEMKRIRLDTLIICGLIILNYIVKKLYRQISALSEIIHFYVRKSSDMFEIHLFKRIVYIYV